MNKTNAVMKTRTETLTAPQAGWVLLFLTAAGLVLRLVRLNALPLWNDESIQFNGIMLPFTELRTRHLFGIDHMPPFSYWIQRIFWLPTQSLWAARLPGALAGTAMIPLFYHVMRRCTDRIGGLLGAALAACSFFLVYYAQELRAYIFQGLALVVFLGYWFELLNTRCGKAIPWKTWLAFVAAGLVSGCFHFSTLVLLPTMGFVTALWLAGRAFTERSAGFPRPEVIRLLQFAGALLVVLLGIYVLMRYSMGPKYEAMARTAREQAAAPTPAILGSLLLKFSWGRGWRLLPVVGLAILGLVSARGRARTAAWTSAGVFILTILLGAYVYPHLGFRSFNAESTARYLFWLCWCMLVPMTIGLRWLAGKRSAGRPILATAVLAAAVTAIQAPLLYHYYRLDEKRIPLRAIKSFIEQRARPQLVLLSNTYDMHNLQFYWPTNGIPAYPPTYEVYSYEPLKIADWIKSAPFANPDAMLKSSFYHPFEPELQRALQEAYARHTVVAPTTSHARILQDLGVKPLDAVAVSFYYNEPEDLARRAAVNGPLAIPPIDAPMLSTRGPDGRYSFWRLLQKPSEITVIAPEPCEAVATLLAVRTAESAGLGMVTNGVEFLQLPLEPATARVYNLKDGSSGTGPIKIEHLVRLDPMTPLVLPVARKEFTLSLNTGTNILQVRPYGRPVLIGPVMLRATARTPAGASRAVEGPPAEAGTR